MAVLANNVPIIGNAARDWLSQGTRGKVLASVNHATYLLTEHGELVWLATAESPKHRRCIQWPAQLPRLAVDSTFSIRGQSIILESGTKLNFRDSHSWVDKSLHTNDIIEIKQLPAKLIAVGETIISRKTPKGFGSFILPVLQIAEGQNSSTRFQLEDILTTTAWPIVERIARACLSHDLPAVLPHAEGLIGLGEGLTPSGDDFLGGLFYACFLLSCSYPTIKFFELDDLPGWVDAHRSRTNQISFALLLDNASGHALEPLNRFAIALLTNEPVEKVISAASDQISIGHSTGWDLLAGFVTGMLLATPN